MSSVTPRFRGGRGWFACAALVLAGAGGLPGQSPAGTPARADAERCQAKIDRIVRFGLEPARSDAAPRRTILTERELNAYTLLVLQPQLPAGVLEPTVELFGDGRFAVRAVFDLDAVRASRSRTLADPWRYLGGRLAVSLTAAIRTSAGRGVLELISATAGGVPLPKLVVQELVSYATRHPESPEGLRFDEPFPLPANIREVIVSLGQATVIQ